MSWRIYDPRNPVSDESRQRWLKKAPPWRCPQAVPNVEREVPAPKPHEQRGRNYVSSSLFRQEGEEGPDEADRINIALLVRRPLLVTGDPGIGKSSLAYHLAHVLRLGAVLRWEINSRTTLADGLYSYDAVDHLRAIKEQGESGIADFIHLGPLGTALLPTAEPRVLLVDELDKSSYDLPNDLLHVFEEGAFRVDELARSDGTELVWPSDCGGESDRVPISGGRVRTHHHPVVVITSNKEREFPPAFLRRCVQLELRRPTGAHLHHIVQQQLGDVVSEEEIASLLHEHPDQATDVFLQALFLNAGHGAPVEDAMQSLKRDRR